jgi:hypothetical protein
MEMHVVVVAVVYWEFNICSIHMQGLAHGSDHDPLHASQMLQPWAVQVHIQKKSGMHS